MGIGSTIRTEGSPMATEAWAKAYAQNRPVILPRHFPRKIQEPVTRS